MTTKILENDFTLKEKVWDHNYNMKQHE